MMKGKGRKGMTQSRSEAVDPARGGAGEGHPEPARPEAVMEVLFRTSAALLRTFDEAMQAEGFSFTWYDVLVQLHIAPDQRMRMQDLADAVVFSRSGLTRLIDRMEREGLVERAPVEGDRRGTYAVLTDEGQATFERYFPGHRAVMHEHFGRHLDEADLQALDRALRKVWQANALANKDPRSRPT
jgi:DNA-binding MarR family transcriptional regulator